MSFETVTVHGVNCLLRSILFPSHFHLKLWDQPSKGTESIVCFGFAALSIILYLMVQFLALLEIGLLVPLQQNRLAQLDHHVRIIHPSHVHQIDYCPEIGS